jgi:hypothetical protein
MGANKNSSQRRWLLQQDEHDKQNTSPTQIPKLVKTTQPLEYYWSYEPTTTETLDQNAQRKTTQPAVCATPVRPMAPAGQTGGHCQSGR